MKKLTLLFSMLLIFAGLVAAQEQSPVKFSGIMFGDYEYYTEANNGANKLENGFEFRRIDFTADYTIDPNFSTRFRLESDETSKTNTSGGQLGVYVKDASMKWANIFSGSDVIVGLSPTPAFDVSEGAWAHRYLEKTIMDYNGIVSSRDIGVDLKGSYGTDFIFKYWLKMGDNTSNNGLNSSGTITTRYKAYYGLVELDPSPNWLFTAYGELVTAPDKYVSSTQTSYSNGTFIGSLFLNYRIPKVFSVGAEGYIKSQANNYQQNSSSSYTAQNGDGISVWAYGNLCDDLQLVARYDGSDPNTANNSASSISDFKTLILFGLQYSPSAHTNITPNIEIVHYQAAPTNGGNAEDVIPRITFSWTF
jgi:hypothetical protein